MNTSNNSGQGFRPDINWTDSSAFNNQHNRQKEKGISNKFSLLEYLSYLQVLSIQERIVKNELDEDLFTIGQTVNGISLGFKVGFFMNIFIAMYILCFWYFTTTEPRISKSIDYAITHIWILLVIVGTLWLGYYSKYVSGLVTKKMVTSLFVGKMVSSIMTGGILVYLFLEAKIYFAQPDLINNMSFLNLQPTLILHNYSVALTLIVFQIIVSSFFAFVMLQFRHFIITGDMKKDYESY